MTPSQYASLSARIARLERIVKLIGKINSCYFSSELDAVQEELKKEVDKI